MKVFTKLMFGLVLLMASLATRAQTNIANYKFSRTTGATYTPLPAGDSTAFSGTYDNSVSTAIPLGGTFTYGGVAYTTCFISTNGFITFGAASGTAVYTPLSTAASSVLGVVAAYAQDAGGSTVTGASPRISYANVGSEFVVQFQDHANYFDRASNRMNFQIRLNLSTNAINIVYGNCTLLGTSTSGTTAQVGLRGNSTSWADNVNNLYLPNIPAGTTCNWADAVTGNSNSSSILYAGANTNINIPNGLTYTWTPATSPAPVRSFYAVSNITTSGAKITWAPATGATQYNVQYRVLGACSWTDMSGGPVSDTTATLSGLNNGTVYQVRIQSSGSGSVSIWSHIPSSAAGSGTNGYTTSGTFATTALCPVPTSVAAGSVTATSASITFTSTGNSFIVEYGATGFTPGTGATAGTGGTIVTGTASPIALNNLTPNTTYQVYVRQNCTTASNGFSSNTASISFTTPALPPANDLPSGAITLTVDADCSAAPYTNAGATLSANEPRISCKGSQTSGATVWFKFVAPQSGFVRVSTDVTGNGLTDTKLGVFSAADTSLASFQIIACDDDNGVVLGNSSIVYVSGLTPGATYYVAVDHYNGASTGTFCVQVHTMTTAMMATGTCATAGQSNYPLAAYTGQLSMTSSTGLLIANVRATAALGSDPSYTPYANINTGAVRTDSLGRYYLNRNFRITNTTSGNYNVQFFFLNSELAALQAVSPGVTLASLNSTKVKNESQCNNNLVSGGVANDSLLTQVANGTANGISWVNVVTPGFSNFYLHQGNVPLPITFEYLKGKNAGTGNALNWKVNCTSASVTMVLERSADARKFDHIVTSITASQARCGQPFDATDATPLKGTNYYRLKMIDVDGKISYSPVVAILYGKAGAELVGIYPTVVRNEAYLSVTASRTTKMQIAISDMSGKVIRTMTENVVSGSSVLTINTNNIASGVYNITGMLDGVKTGTLRFVKE